MAFDWFRRKFSKTASETSAEEKQEDSPQAVEPAEETPSPPPQTSSVDLLAYAKAAYQNIQKQKAAGASPAAPALETSQTFEPETVPPSEAETNAEVMTAIPLEIPEAGVGAEPKLAAGTTRVEASPETVTEPAPSSEVPGAEESTVAPTTSEPEPELISSPALEPVLESPIGSTTPEVTSTAPAPQAMETLPEAAPEPTAPLPFWARTAAERQERLERLRETAIVEPEPIPESVVAEATSRLTEPAAEPMIAFDEGFLWTAEILAAQGRRPEEISVEEITWLKKLRQGLSKTRLSLVNQLKAIVGQGPLNQEAVMEIEALLLQADVGVAATDLIIGKLQQKMREEVLPPDGAINYLKQILRQMLDQSHNPTFAPQKETLNIWLITGVNGAGKTTTIGKIAHIAQKSGYKCMIAAADTFRAAAVEQIKIWGQRSGVEVISNPGQNTDPAAVVFDAITAAQSRNVELLLVDTAGRLQNKKNLMEELNKVRRIIDKKAPNARIESLLVLDSTLGQNGLRQAEVFSESAKLTGVVLTKLDGTAKGGIALAVVEQLGLPIRFIGAGEGIEDLRPFSSYEFIEALLSG